MTAVQKEEGEKDDEKENKKSMKEYEMGLPSCSRGGSCNSSSRSYRGKTLT